jgi:hypothetical protein
MPIKHITIGFSIHRPEMIPITADLMRHHEAIFLEEPPTPGFKRMLQGSLSIEEYLLPIDVEYPEFSHGMCRLMRELHRSGKKIVQVEPFLEHLLAIHDFFSKGHGPEELKPEAVRYQVYLAERNATKALIDYYETVMSESFEAAVRAILGFARFDAARFRLRDILRAELLTSHLKKYQSVFIEAGTIHYSLWQLLRQRLPKEAKVNPVFLPHKALKSFGENGHLFGPGDQLTLRYIFHPNIRTTLKDELLAARSLIYTKLIEKEELLSDLKTFPHVRNELDCIRAVKLLNLRDCGRLFPLIRGIKTEKARKLVEDYLVRIKNLHPIF